MPVLNNPRHERFCQFLAQGKTATEAYELAGYKPSRFNASHLADNPKVIERLQQITTRNGVKSAITVESLLAEFEEVRAAAMGQETRQFNAANQAIKGKAVLTGNWVERAEIGQAGEFDHLTDEELEREVRELLVELGFLTPDPEVIGGTDQRGNATGERPSFS